MKNSAEKQEAAVAGAVAAAHYIRSIAPIYGVPVILHTDHCMRYPQDLWFNPIPPPSSC